MTDLLRPARDAKTTLWRWRRLRRLAARGEPVLRYCRASCHPRGRLEPRCRFELGGGVALSARPTDVMAVEEILLFGEYEAALATLGQAGPAPAVVDLGANIGVLSALVLARHVDARVVSVEAGPDTFAVLDGNRRSNPGRSWTTIHAAAAGARGSMRFSCSALSTGGRVSGDGPGVEVPALPLAEILPPGGISLLKVDIEGAEEALLRTGEPELARVRAMVIELHPGRCDTDACRMILARSFPRVVELGGRRSSKPVLLATR